MRPLLAAVLAIPGMLLAGCSEPAVKEFTIHIGWGADGRSQYMEPKTITVEQGDRVRFVVINDDDPNRDYNGARPGRDNFHDVALLDYDGQDYEHEAPAGSGPVKTCVQEEIGKPCSRDWFVASLKGTFRIICEVRTTPTHDQLGMHATFVVQ